MNVQLEKSIIAYDVNAHKSFYNDLNDADFNLKRGKLSKDAQIIKGVFDAIKSLFSYIRKWIWFSHTSQKRQVLALYRQIYTDQKLIPEAQRHRIRQINDVALGHWQGTKKDRNMVQEISVATYATTYHHFAPVIYDWVISLMQRAQQENLHLVFMARDGLSAYQTAQQIQVALPELNCIKTSYIYLSGKIVGGDPVKLQKYIEQELKTSEDQAKFMFVDIGFFGRLVEPIISATSIAIPNAQCQFEFLFSLAPGVKGFAASLPNTMRAIKSASQNRAVFWIEDTHNGNVSSPTELVEDAKGTLIPKRVKKSQVKQNPVADHMYRENALNALRDYVAKQDHRAELNKLREVSTLNPLLRDRFEKWLAQVRQDRFLYIEHTE